MLTSCSGEGPPKATPISLRIVLRSFRPMQSPAGSSSREVVWEVVLVENSVSRAQFLLDPGCRLLQVAERHDSSGASGRTTKQCLPIRPTQYDEVGTTLGSVLSKILVGP